MERYSRHFNLPGFTQETQAKLRNSRVVVIGAGGLGIPVLQYIVAAGVGSITIIDDDEVSLTNLQRQVLFKEKDIGRSKAKVAMKRLKKLNSQVEITSISERINENNIERIVGPNLDVIIDASDNFKTRYCVDEFCFEHKIPLIYGAIHRYEGQMAVFNYNDGPRYIDLFPQAPEEGTVDNCDINGVLGPVAGNIGCLMANEAIKILTGIGKVQNEELIVMRFDELNLMKMKIPKGRQAIDLASEQTKVYHSISSYDLKTALDEEEEIHLIDVRSSSEFLSRSIEGSVNIPKEQILDRLEEIPRDKEVILICNIGQSSMNVIRYLQNELEYSNLINLNGGIFSYFQEDNYS